MRATIEHETAYKTRNKNNNNNLRCVRNTIGEKYLTSNAHKKHTRGNDINDTSSQYYKTILIANSAQKTYYVKYNGVIQKLKSVKSQLKHKNIKYYVSSDYNYITYKEDNELVTLRISYTNGILLHNKTDRTQLKHIYN